MKDYSKNNATNIHLLNTVNKKEIIRFLFITRIDESLQICKLRTINSKKCYYKVLNL